MNSATNPRKFAEKIAKLHQKEQEQTQAFEQIMAEVIVATRDVPKAAVPSKHHLHIHQSVSGSRAESLPNVNHVSRSGQNSIDLQSALSNLEQIKQGKSPGRERRHSPGGMLTPAVRGHSPRSAAHPEQRRASPASPYSTPYLSPPDTWRRTNSDSALHQSSILADRQNASGTGYSGLQQQHISRRSPAAGQMGSSSLTNISQAGDSGAQSTSESWDERNRQYQVQMTGHPDMIMDSGLRPKSCDVPGITIFPSQEDGCHNGNQPHIPLSANTGSLPDLSSFHFPAPLSNPIDPEELAAAAAQSSSTPASNSHSSSLHYPNPGSPYGTGRQQAASPFNSNPNSPFSPQSPLSALGYSPPGDTGQLTFENISHMKDSSVLQQAVRYSQYGRSAAAPTITVEGLALDTSALSLDANHHYHANSVQDSRSFNGGSAVDQQNLTYPSNCHQVHSGFFHDRNGSPSEHSNSAPSSPIAPQNHPASPPGPESVRLIESDNSFSSGFPTSVLQHQFQQFKMVNNFTDPESIQMMQGSAGHSSSSSASSSTGGLFMTTVQAQQQQHSHNRPDNVMGQEFVTITSGNGPSFGRTSDSSGHYATRNLPLSASSLMSSSSVPTLYSKSVISCAPSQYSQQRQVVHSPQTSDSIPEIVLTEPLSESDGLLRHEFPKDMGSAMGSFDASDLFSSDSFKSELPIDPIDFDGLQILTEMTESDERLERS